MHSSVSPAKAVFVRPTFVELVCRSLLLLVLPFAVPGSAHAGEAENEETMGLNSLPGMEFKIFSQNDWSPLGARALDIHPADWKHGETEHFI